MEEKNIESKVNMPYLDDNDRMDVSVGILKSIANRTIVSNSHAILELIKNAFDEDSYEVLVNFVFEAGKISEIRVLDEGYGFTKNGFDSFKLVGKSEKTANTKTPLGRIATGMYGSGAYSTIKLGNYLRINSVNNRDNFILNKEMDWTIIYKNPDKRVRDLIFKTLTQFEFTEKSGTQLIIKDIRNSFDLKKILNDLIYVTIRDDFKVRFINNGKKTEAKNFIKRLNEIKQIDYDFVTHSVSFSYLKGKIKLELEFIKEEKELWEITSSVSDFKGKITGSYLSINKNLFKAKKDMFSEYPLFKGFKGNKALNLFYNNEMLVLTDEVLGLDLELLSIKEKGSYGFRNSFGYTAIQETNLMFNDSRTSITDDSQGYYQKYKIILDEIFENIRKKISKIISTIKKKDENDINIDQETNSPINAYNPKIDLSFTAFPKITTISIESELFEELKKVVSLLDKSNSYYKHLVYCIRELQLMLSKKNYILNFNISFYAVVRVYCEILFIYKVYDFFTNEADISKVINMCKQSYSNDFKSIGGLLRLMSSSHWLIEKFSKDFKEKTNQNKLNYVENLVKKINNHIHKPDDKIEESIALDLIKIFTKWL